VGRDQPGDGAAGTHGGRFRAWLRRQVGHASDQTAGEVQQPEASCPDASLDGRAKHRQGGRGELEEAHTQLRQRKGMREQLALTDPLTNLPNRRAMDRLVRAELQRRARHPDHLSLAIIDVDHFKDVNTRYLLPGGDHVLVWLAQSLSQSLRTIDTVRRTGGEEFMVLAPGTDAEGAFVLAERIRKRIEESETIYQGQPVRITVSAGVAVAPATLTTNYDQLKMVAANALGEAKAAGRNRNVVQTLAASERQ